MTPFFLLQFLSIKVTPLSVARPMLGQYQLLERATFGEAIALLHIGLSVTGTCRPPPRSSGSPAASARASAC